MRCRLLTLVLLILPGLSGLCAAPNPDASASVILISIDTLRADHLSAYGYTKIRTPHIDSFALGGTRFAQAEAQVPLTLPSHTSLFTSTYPFENRVEENGERVPAGIVTLASVLRSRGYQTAAFIGSEFLDQRFGLDQGFDVYDSPFGQESSRVENPLAMSLRRDGALVERAAEQWLQAHRGQPVFVFVHLFDLHFLTLCRRKSRAGMASPATMLNSNTWTKSWAASSNNCSRAGGGPSLGGRVFGDHGEGLGDHQETDHGYYVYESTLHVPLIVHWPAGAPSFAAVWRSPVGLIDVAPTVLDYLRVPAPGSFEGVSQLGALKAGDAASLRAVYSESLYAHDAFGWSPLRALRVGKYKYIQAPKAELYDLDADPYERANLLRTNAAMAAELENEMANLLTRYAPSPRSTSAALSPETIAELESLGYLAAQPRPAGEAARHDVALPDPKDRFSEFQLYQNAFETLTEGHAATALPKFQSILKSDPQNTLARFHLGECYLQTKKPQDALRAWAATLNLDPQYAPAAEAIGQYWLQQGDYAKARRRFQQVLALTPESYTGHFELAVTDEHLGLLPEAREHLAAACKLAPHDQDCARKLKSLAQR